MCGYEKEFHADFMVKHFEEAKVGNHLANEGEIWLLLEFHDDREGA